MSEHATLRLRIDFSDGSWWERQVASNGREVAHLMVDGEEWEPMMVDEVVPVTIAGVTCVGRVRIAGAWFVREAPVDYDDFVGVTD